jgi:hypothetical protein
MVVMKGFKHMRIQMEKEQGEGAGCLSPKQTCCCSASDCLVRDLVSEAGEHGAPAVKIELAGLVYMLDESHIDDFSLG